MKTRFDDRRAAPLTGGQVPAILNPFQPYQVAEKKGGEADDA
jgi:hypothetical protein